MPTSLELPTARTLIWLLVTVIFLSITNYVLLPAAGAGRANDVEGNAVGYASYRSANIQSLFLTMPVLGFLLGGFSRFIPLGRWTGPRKYVATSLLCLAGLQVLFLLIRQCGIVPA